jgi:Zn finger protein HypA/HybF involved in hydrogenase expression
MKRTKITCEKCEREISRSNYEKHTSSCKGRVVKKIRGIDFDPNWGFKEGVRSAWNKGLPSEKKGKTNEYYHKIRHETPTEKLGYGPLRLRIIEEQNHKCNKCGLSEWLGQPMVFELEHKDGNKRNNVRSNLEILCPNCHSQTHTWRGRKNKLHCDPASEGAVLIRQ